MPSGRSHATATCALAAALTLAAPALFDRCGPQALAVIPGVLAGLLVSPDLDVDSGADPFRQARRFGGLAGAAAAGAWRLIWLPYARIVPHRSIWSHAPLIGTALRVAYLLALGPACALPGVIGEAWFWWGLAGLAAADGLHGAMDWIF